MFILFSASLILCGVIAAASDFPDFLMKNTKESEGPGVRFVANPQPVGYKPCQVDVKIIKPQNGRCTQLGLGVNACVTDTHVEPFHPGCL